MLLEEAQARLKKTEINQEQLWGLNSLYILLDLHKDEFCKIIDMVGLETLLKKQSYYDRLDKAYRQMQSREKYYAAVQRLNELENERHELQEFVRCYEEIPI